MKDYSQLQLLFFGSSNSPTFGKGSIFTLTPESFWNEPCLFEMLLTSLISDMTRFLRIIYTVPASDLESATSSRSPGSFLLERVFQGHKLGARDAYCWCIDHCFQTSSIDSTRKYICKTKMFHEFLWTVLIHIRTLGFIIMMYYLTSSVSSTLKILVVKDSGDDRWMIDNSTTCIYTF